MYISYIDRFKLMKLLTALRTRISISSGAINVSKRVHECDFDNAAMYVVLTK